MMQNNESDNYAYYSQDQFQDIFRELTEVERTLSDVPKETDVPWRRLLATSDSYHESENKDSV